MTAEERVEVVCASACLREVQGRYGAKYILFACVWYRRALFCFGSDPGANPSWVGVHLKEKHSGLQ